MLLHSLARQVDVAGLALAVVLAAFSLWVSFLSRKRTASNRESRVYQDKDGVASEESQKAYSVHLQNTLLILITFLGISVGLVEAILVTISQPADTCAAWTAFVFWVSRIAPYGTTRAKLSRQFWQPKPHLL